MSYKNHLLIDIENMDEKTTDQMIEEIGDYYKKESEDFERRWNEKQKLEQQKKYNELMERLAREKEEREKEEQIKQIARQKELEQKWANGEIQDVFIKQYMEGQITVARWALALGMAVTLLFKGQWLIWIVMIIVYVIYVNNVKAKALEADRNKFKR